MNIDKNVSALIAHYGDGTDGNSPLADQWRQVLDRDPEAAFALVNFFKFRQQALYTSGEKVKRSGKEAFELYAEVSVPSMQKAGGEFLAVAPFGGTLLGEDNDWDLVAIGKYPNLDAFLRLYLNEDYIHAFKHRVAAVASQSVVIMNAN